ncbi:S8 family serine peptidase [Streptomyces sp. NPDC026673]|uniref:S8 family peptidase n=1 Tax=Streptomyces sp. NPDC026673 TaxID=3155724 RepID=UPI0033E3F256
MRFIPTTAAGRGTTPWSTRATVAAAAATAVVTLTTAVPTHAYGTAPKPAAAAKPGTFDGRAVTAQWTVTLVTGDVVNVQRFAGGRQAATVKPAAGNEHESFSTREVDGRLHVMPASALPYVASGRLDRSLFDVTSLIEQGYDDAHAAQLPLIVSYGDAVDSLRTQNAPAGTRRTAVLNSVHGASLSARKADLTDFWKAATAPSRQGRAGTPRLAGNIDKVWLDGKVTADLDRSVAQIGAPEVWKSGYTGKGVKVAVLDTGADADHPDLRGRITEGRNFAEGEGIADRFGHGTHVAATVAGSGAGSGGTRKGVAPDAELVIGKVLNDEGYGQESWIMAGMEWAARSGASVVNLSLGGAVQEDDPMAAAVDRLTEETGTLFVVAAGNEGPGSGTVGSPGVAERALTVGAVDHEDTLAGFSSRGPVDAAYRVKPEVTAPGVDIVAARAQGTAMGTPVDELYTSASGTSMATPHVAGAAALLAQQHPDWTPGRIKDALVGTAKAVQNAAVDAQGSGRMDVARASAQAVHATGTLNLGVTQPDQGPVNGKVTYTNDSRSEVRLSLSLDVRGADGTAAPAGMFAAGSSTVTVAPGATATVPVTATPAADTRGRFTGHLTATGADGSVRLRTAVALTVQGALRTITLTGLDRSGKGPHPVTWFQFYGSDSRWDTIGSFLPQMHGESVSFRLPEDTYFFAALAEGTDAIGDDNSLVIRPELKVTGDMTLVVDPRKAVKVDIRTPKPAESQGMVHYGVHRAFAGRDISTSVVAYSTMKTLYVTPTDKPANGSFEAYSRWQLTPPRLNVKVLGRNAPELYATPLVNSPLPDGTRRLPLVDVGTGTKEELAGKDLRGKIALVDPGEFGFSNVAGVGEGGAAAILMKSPFPGAAWQPWTPQGERLPVMSALISRDHGKALSELLSRGEVRISWSLVSASPYQYDVMLVQRDRVPGKLLYRVDRLPTATVKSRYHRPGDSEWHMEQRFSWRPWQTTDVTMEGQSWVKVPSTRTETVSADDTVWLHRVSHTIPWSFEPLFTNGMMAGFEQYAPGESRNENWYRSVIRPAAPKGVEGFASVRKGDTLSLRIPEFSDSDGHYSFAEYNDQVNTRLYQDGKLVAEQRSPWGDLPVTGGGDYRLQVRTSRPAGPEWQVSTSTDTSWRFSSRTTQKSTLLPLIQLDYGVPVDGGNKVRATGPTAVSLKARHQDGLKGPRIDRMQAWVSYDDGAHWTKVTRLSHEGTGAWKALIDPKSASKGTGYVSLRVQAQDTAGDLVDQTVIRAYGVHAG